MSKKDVPSAEHEGLADRTALTLNLTAQQARLLRMRAQHLASPTQQLTAGQLLTEIFAVQAQNLAAAYQSLGVRSRGL